MPADIISSTTQQFLDIHDITNNFVIMKDGTVSVVLTVDAMNFGLLAEEEQDAIMYAYAGLLNSLNYPIQILIHSQTKDVTVYLQLLKDQEESASSDTMRRRIRQYREFVSNLIHERNVLDKKFYVTIPATALELGILGSSGILPGQKKFDISQTERSILLEKAQNLLDPKRDHLIAQFARIGLFSRQLSTQEIIQLFYVRYNPEAIEGQQIAESRSYTAPLVQASIQGSVMSNDQANIPPSPANSGAPTQPNPTAAPTSAGPATMTAGANSTPAAEGSPQTTTPQPAAPTTSPVTTPGEEPANPGSTTNPTNQAGDNNPTAVPSPAAPASTDPQPDPIASPDETIVSPGQPKPDLKTGGAERAMPTPSANTPIPGSGGTTPTSAGTQSEPNPNTAAAGMNPTHATEGMGGSTPPKTPETTPAVGEPTSKPESNLASDSNSSDPDEAAAQADLNSAIEGLGSSPTTTSPAASTTPAGSAAQPPTNSASADSSATPAGASPAQGAQESQSDQTTQGNQGAQTAQTSRQAGAGGAQGGSSSLPPLPEI